MNLSNIYVRWLALPALGLALIFLIWGAATGPAHAPWTLGETPAAESDFALATLRLETARASEFGLVIDLEKETTQLVFGATPLREVDITGAAWSRPGPDARLGVVSGRIASRKGTLPFEPVQRVQAPADTASAEPPTIRPLDSHPAYGVLVLEDGTEIRLRPTDLSAGESLTVLGYRATAYLGRVADVVGRLVTGKSAPEENSIILPMPDKDARAIFRALPLEAPVYVRYPVGT